VTAAFCLELQTATRSLTIALLFAFVFLVASSTMAGQSDNRLQQPDWTSVLNQLEEGRTTLEDSVLAQTQARLEKCVASDAKDWRCEYQLARVAFYRALGAQLRRDSHQEQRWTDVGILHVQRALLLNEGFAEAHSLLADLYAKKITGMLSGPKFGPKITAENRRALALNSNSAVVEAGLGREFLFKPRMFGGNVDKALEALRKSVQLDPQSDESWVWLAVALRKKGDDQEADKAIAQALILNSRSVFAQRVRAGDR
jgi:tetratricopeptide (TPR) repeat protein